MDVVVEIARRTRPGSPGTSPAVPSCPASSGSTRRRELVRGFVRRDGRPLEVAGFRNVRFLTPVEGAARATIAVGPAVGAGPGELRLEVDRRRAGVPRSDRRA